MCGRVSIQSEIIFNEYQKAINKKLPDNYNVAPTQEAYVVTADEPGLIQTMHFGLVPYWSTSSKMSFSTINARAETIMEKPVYRPLMTHGKRCLVLVDGFYDWKTEDVKKQPYRFTLKNRPAFALAGLWSRWVNKEIDQVYDSFTIITTDPNDLLAAVHNRMPVILSKFEEEFWLSKDISASELLMLCDQYPSEEMNAFKVSTQLNNVRNNYPDLIEPLLY